MLPEVNTHNSTNMPNLRDKRLWAEKKQSDFQNPLPASCLQQDQVSRPHKSVYFSEASKTRILAGFSLSSTNVCPCAHGELKKLHLEQSFTVYWNACCGWKLSLCGGKMIIYSKPLPLAENIWIHLILCLHNNRPCALVPRSGICLFSDCQSDAVSWLIWVSWVHCVPADLQCWTVNIKM